LGWAYKAQKEGRELWGSGLAYFTQQGSAFLENTLSMTFLVSAPIAVICQAANNQALDLEQPNPPAVFFYFCLYSLSLDLHVNLVIGFSINRSVRYYVI